ncbi:hypothetical protein [Aeromonas sp. 600724]|uniref:hypothetical protein n=1 Tax=Aeromonas sp. 600724 TaxID=2712031 RepID=UPI003B9F0EF2
MNILDVFTISAIMSAIATILGWWLKSRLDSSIQHEYSKLLEQFKAQQRRSDLLHSERLSALKALATKLLALRRYCNARSAEVRNESEFEPRTESLSSEENLSLLQHRQQIERAVEERELFLSPNVRRSFNELFSQMSLGFNLELWIASGQSESELNAAQLFNLIAEKANDVMSALYQDLNLPDEIIT